MERRFTPMIITSKKARRDIIKIREQAEKVVKDHAEHMKKRGAWLESKKQLQEAKRMENEVKTKDSQARIAQERQMAMEHERKMKELDLKRALLS